MTGDKGRRNFSQVQCLSLSSSKLESTVLEKDSRYSGSSLQPRKTRVMFSCRPCVRPSGMSFLLSMVSYALVDFHQTSVTSASCLGSLS